MRKARGKRGRAVPRNAMGWLCLRAMGTDQQHDGERTLRNQFRKRPPQPIENTANHARKLPCRTAMSALLEPTGRKRRRSTRNLIG
jgi:hypothetical protein